VTVTDDASPAGGSGLLDSLRRHAVLIVIVALLVGGLAALGLSQRDPEYRATAQVLFAPPGIELAIIGADTPQSNNTDRQAATNVAIVEAGAIARVAARRLGDVSTRALRSSMTIDSASDSDVVDVTASAKSTAEAQRRADTYAATVVDQRRALQARRARLVRRGVQQELDALSRRLRRSGEGARLREQIFELDTLERHGTGSPSVVQRAADATERVDNPRQLTALALLFGLLLGAALALLRDRSDRRVRDVEDLAGALDVPVLASVGRSAAIRRGASFDDLPERDREVFRFLHGKLRFGDASQPRAVLVTSARDGEGKTAVAAYLAAAAAAAGDRALLVEADVRRPDVAQRLGLESKVGLAQVLAGAVALDDALAPVAVGQGAHALDVLPAGTASADAAPVLQSEAMRDLLERVRSEYDLTVIDSAPLGLVADALPLVGRVDGVLLATFVGRSDAAEVRRLRWQVAEMGGRVLGVVVSNGRRGSGYGYAAQEPPAPSVPRRA
jgi:succinoglycan biosynthesis transport protein ExoP